MTSQRLFKDARNATVVELSALEACERVDKFLFSVGLFDSIRDAKASVEAGRVQLNRHLCTQSTQAVDRGYVVTVFLSTHLVGYEPVSLLYKDDDVLVVNKGPGILTVSKDGNASVLAHLKRQFGDSVDAVHRLDRDTSGVIVFSRNAASTERLLDQFRRRTVKKVYEAVAHQTPRLSIPPKGLWKSELALVKKFPVPRWGSVLKGGETAITAYRVLGSGGGLTRLELSPKTGRTHQLRVHCSEHGLPLVGDAIYGTPERDRKVGATKLLLHARKVTFLHPRSQKALSVEAPVPAYFPVSLPVT